ncbi:Gfo/Idh/MocA family protein [Halosimplex amylolyticum]|uniref:Gfo/Idh/MocA family protein n=1 Tax=Halosimplex amylolyticum TaxID=3396616 RepID=UPI003F5457B7
MTGDASSTSEATAARIGIVGLGTIGRIHAERLDRLGADLAGADLDRDAREAFAEEFDAQSYEDHRALLDAGVDAVVVCVPNRFHEEVAVDALAAGADVLVEKPLAHSVESAERIAAAAREAAGFCSVGFTMRYATPTQRAIELREAGRFGSLSHVRVDYLRRGGVPGGGDGWFTDPELAGGGVAMDLGVHVVDLALHLLDYPAVAEVTAETRSEFGDYPVEDSVTALLRCADGATVAVDASWHGTCAPSRECVIRGTDAGATFDVTETSLAVVDADSDATADPVSLGENEMHLAEDRALLDAVAGDGDPPGGTVEAALTVQRVLAALYESSERGEAVRLDGGRD